MNMRQVAESSQSCWFRWMVNRVCSACIGESFSCFIHRCRIDCVKDFKEKVPYAHSLNLVQATGAPRDHFFKNWPLGILRTTGIVDFPEGMGLKTLSFFVA